MRKGKGTAKRDGKQVVREKKDTSGKQMQKHLCRTLFQSDGLKMVDIELYFTHCFCTVLPRTI